MTAVTESDIERLRSELMDEIKRLQAKLAECRELRRREIDRRVTSPDADIIALLTAKVVELEAELKAQRGVAMEATKALGAVSAERFNAAIERFYYLSGRYQ